MSSLFLWGQWTGRTTFCTALMLAMMPYVSAQDQTGKSEDTSVENRYSAPQEGGPRRWEVSNSKGLKVYASPTMDATVVDSLVNGAVLSNLGCELIKNIIWCHIKPLQSRVRGYVAAEHLLAARGPDGVVPIGVDDSTHRARLGEFDATGNIRCAQISNQPMGRCAYSVARSSGGDATVVVTFSNGFKRLLLFSHGVFIRADTTMSGTGFDTDWRIEGNLHIIRVDDQSYELPSIAVFGG